ncbi:MAG TPA: PAS domain-containing protein [Bacillota bacterium]|nr:PAS domain-containing protein [Bacillota bacterium]
MRIAVTDLNKDVLLRQLLDAMPAMVFLVDGDLSILDCNVAASAFLGLGRQSIVQQRSGEVFHCVHASETPGGCGHSHWCKDCAVRAAVGQALASGKTVRRRLSMERNCEGKERELPLLLAASPFQYQGRMLVVLTLEEIGESAELQRLLPICARCKKVRNDAEYWSHVDHYLYKHLNLNFTQSLCPDCFHKEIQKAGGVSAPQPPE